MPRRAERGPELYGAEGGCRQCGYPHPQPWTSLQKAEHALDHHIWESPDDRLMSRSAWVARADLYRRWRTLFEAFDQKERNRLNARVCDLEIELESTRWDLKVTSELVDDLKADLAAVEEGRR